PYVASTISTDYGPIGNIVLNMSTDNIPGELSRLLTNDKFEQTYQTPFGKFTITVTSNGIYQELVRPDRKVIVEETPDFTKWELIAKNYNLIVNKTGTKITEKFTSPDGYQETTKEMGNIEEIVRGNVENYGEAKELLEEELQRMEKIKQDYMNIPGTDHVTSGEKIAINELLPDPNGTQDYNHDGNFTDAGDEFIEIYNYGDEEVDLSGWELRDGSVLTIPQGTILDSGEFIYFVSGDKDGDYGNEWSGSWPSLTNNGDEIKLYDDEDKLVDTLAYTTSTTGKSWSRIPDGTGGIEETDPTPGSSN
ncbi:MAG: lamin tail domain-containing protein, partial [Candidatus Aenigmarchaeota archaeon]|nr:lamin tail domain-containing protein [Candidatus Aenigmarchaeota archaeon]